jgi:hypothetical protein
VLSGRGLCDRPITRPEGSIECGMSECDLEISTMRGPRPTGGGRGRQAMKKISMWVATRQEIINVSRNI